MKRRRFIAKTTTAAATTTALGACVRVQTNNAQQAGALPKVRWRMATSWPKALGIFGGAETFSKRVQEMSILPLYEPLHSTYFVTMALTRSPLGFVI